MEQDWLTEELEADYNKLTDKQRAFVELWNGNAKETADMVGYSVPEKAGPRLTKKVEISRLIRAKRLSELKSKIMSREERQELWTRIAKGLPRYDENGEVIKGSIPKVQDQLKAAELLGKSEGDFIERVRNEGERSITIKHFLERPEDSHTDVKQLNNGKPLEITHIPEENINSAND